MTVLVGGAAVWIEVDGYGKIRKKAQQLTLHRSPDQTQMAPSRGRPVPRNGQPFLHHDASFLIGVDVD